MRQLRVRLVRVLIVGVLFAAAITQTDRSARAQVATETADAEAAVLQKKVVDGIQENYRRFPAARCKMVLTTVSAKVYQREVIRGTTDKGTLEFTVTPRSTTEMELILSGSSFRIDCVDPETGDRNSSWFPKKSTRRFFADEHAETPEQDGWTQKVTMEIGPVRTDETFADTAFDIAIAPEIVLRDNTRGREPPPKKD